MVCPVGSAEWNPTLSAHGWYRSACWASRDYLEGIVRRHYHLTKKTRKALRTKNGVKI